MRKIRERIREIYRKHTPSVKLPLIILTVLFCMIPLLVESRILARSSRQEQVERRIIDVQNQCQILSNKMSRSGYLTNSALDNAAIDTELSLLSDIFSGRILIVNQDFQVIKDTYDLDKGKYMISKEVVKCFQKMKESSHYDRKNSYIEMTMPIPGTDGETTQGVLLISISTEEIVSSIDILEQKGLTILVIIGALVLVFGYLLAGILMKPFAKVTRAIEDITDGFQDEKISVPDYTETELITDAFNKMLGRVQSLDTSRQEFVSNVSHELKTPLTSMKVLADSLVGQENVPVELYQEFMQDIAAEIDRESKIITDLLTLVKLNKKASNMNIEQVNINELLDLILKRLRPIAAKRNIELILEGFRPVDAEIDETKLSLAISNLVENAIKYNKDEGWVRVSLNADHKYFYVTVTDSGRGIPEESIDHIFERFYRVDKSHSTEIEGTGLGLAITRSAIMMHHGAIRVKSQVGEGTTFSVRIPLTFID